MKNLRLLFALLLIAICATAFSQDKSYIRVNYAGYLPHSKKVAVYISTSKVSGDLRFQVCEAVSDSVVYEGVASVADPSKWALKEAYRLDFSSLEASGGYYITFKGTQSPDIQIGTGVYEGLSDVLLYYLRQQQCGYNPFTDTLCHQKDGYIVGWQGHEGEMIDVRGGWHDASDYLQYQTTSATAVYHLMAAYKYTKDKSIFKDSFDAMGRGKANGIPDILDQARWGLEWLLKMNPAPYVMFTQIADDRDHIGFKPPHHDTADYGWGAGNGRPVYFLTGEPQGFGKFGKNRTTGASSAAGKFAACFALGAEIFGETDKALKDSLLRKAAEAFAFGKEKPGNTQTACYISRYFYEEDSWVDDMELAAAALLSATSEPEWAKQADYYGELEPVSPWMEIGRGRHYQFYPFINLGHYILATGGSDTGSEASAGKVEPMKGDVGWQRTDTEEDRAAKYRSFMREGLEDLRQRADNEPFMHGVPYLWCSNNLTSAAVTQALLYRKATGDTTYLEMEASLRDWLLGCNPWGTSMIIGYPKGSANPTKPHSAFTLEKREITGGLVDGPVYRSIFQSRAGNNAGEDKTPELNRGIAVYHNDLHDYATNEPTLDGTASLALYFAWLEEDGLKQKKAMQEADYQKDMYGAIRQLDTACKNIYLIFSADSLFNGGRVILETLDKEDIKGSFFFTGRALKLHKGIIKKIIKKGHYVGGHSDQHLLYAPWEAKSRDTLLVSPDSLLNDIRSMAQKLASLCISQKESKWFLPPYEHYNSAAVNILQRAGYKVINYTLGTATPADYTIPIMKGYRPAGLIINQLYAFEKKNSLNGAIILIHPGIENSRPESERLYNRLGEIIKYLKAKGYNFQSFKELCTKS